MFLLNSLCQKCQRFTSIQTAPVYGQKNAVTQILIFISERCRCRACVKMTQTHLLFVVSFQNAHLSGGGGCGGGAGGAGGREK